MALPVGMMVPGKARASDLSGYYSKVLWTELLINNRHLVFTFLEVGMCKMKASDLFLGARFMVNR